MKISQKHILPLFIGLMILLTKCTENEPFEPLYDVPEDFQVMIDTFRYEAELRGVDLEVDNLIIQYDETIEINFCGSCNTNDIIGDVQKIISINTVTTCWNSYFEKEAFFFHELGHCVLGRIHVSDTLQNGAPKSLMVANDRSIYSGCIYQIGGEDGESCDLTERRTYYLDELFDLTTPAPSWAN